jgi:hypothetical protein
MALCSRMYHNLSFYHGIRGLTIKFANSPPCACHDSSGEKPQYCLMTLALQRFTVVLLLIYGSLFLSGVYYCLSKFSVCRRQKLMDLASR